MLLMNIRIRFDSISSEIMNKIQKIKDIEKIRYLFSESFSCNNEKQFIQLIGNDA